MLTLSRYAPSLSARPPMADPLRAAIARAARNAVDRAVTNGTARYALGGQPVVPLGRIVGIVRAFQEQALAEERLFSRSSTRDPVSVSRDRGLEVGHQGRDR